jgi:2-amino-4-hydroxy-6-hydroxymethyldihydropteridine diphosphokinase
MFESASVTGRGDTFFNLVVAAETFLSLRKLVVWLKEIESIHGRRDGARPDRVTLDIDLLTYNDRVGKFFGVELPRAEMLERSYVLYPLSLVAPHARHPRLKLSYEELWQSKPLGPQITPVAPSNLTNSAQIALQVEASLAS